MKEKLGWGKLLLFLLGGMLLSATVIWFSLHDRLHSDSMKGWIFEAVAGTHAYNVVYLYGAMMMFIACLLLFVLVVLAAAKDKLAERAKAARKAERRAAWEAKQAREASGSPDGAP